METVSHIDNIYFLHIKLHHCSHHKGVQNYKNEIIYIKVVSEIVAFQKLHILKFVYISVGKANSKSKYVSI